KTDLQAAGGAFSFPLSAGFAGFDNPPAFLKFNRGLRARSAIYTDDFSGALTALGESFLDPCASLGLGVYHVFVPASGDLSNQLYDPIADQRLYANPALLTEAQHRADNSLDLRAQQKIKQAPASFTAIGLTSDKQFTVYPSVTAPVTIMRNEELILLRAEAN